MGWKENTPLGKSGEGIIDPIQISGAISKLGIGKQEEDNYYTDANKIKRKEMENEKEETPELIKKREVLLSIIYSVRFKCYLALF